VSDDGLRQIAQVTEEVDHSPLDTIFKEGDEAECLYIIVKGEIQIEKEFKDQRRKVLAILSKGDFFGEMAIITNGFRCASAVSVRETHLIRLQKPQFLDLLRNNGHLCFEILQQTCLRLEAADTEIENLTFQNLPGRISAKLLELARQFGVQMPDGSTRVRFELTHAKLAEMVGTNRETVSKYISLFKKEGSISFESRMVSILDSGKLSSWC
jgi:CRP/FNR family transcriptional regulator